MKNYRVNKIDKKLIQEEIKEIKLTEVSEMIRRLERDIERNKERIARTDDEVKMQETELKELKKLAGENNVKY